MTREEFAQQKADRELESFYGSPKQAEAFYNDTYEAALIEWDEETGGAFEEE